MLAQIAAAAAAAALLFSAADARAAHISCGQAITTDMVLDTDLDCRSEPAPALAIAAPGIELDLNGHLLDGEIRTSGFDDVVIRGGTIAGRLTLEGVHRNRVEQIELGEGFGTTDDSGSIFSSTSHDSQFLRVSGTAARLGLVQFVDSDRNKVLDGSRLDINAGGTENRLKRMRDSNVNLLGSNHVMSQSVGGAITVTGHDHAVVHNRPTDAIFVTGNSNRIAENAVSTDKEAISVLNASSNVIEGNRIDARTTASSTAIILFGAKSTVVRRNTISGSSQLGEEPLRPSGVWIQGGSGNTVARNEVSGRALGILASGTVENRLNGNVVHEVGDSGIYLYHADRNVIARNDISRAAVNGITVALSADENQILGNRSRRNGVDGLGVLNAFGTGNLLSENDARFNGDDGIDLDRAGNTVSRNDVRRNLDWGIESVAGTIDAGGNRASGNGQAAQCSNVSCTP
jgi:parallel beta-helix repeat protein